MAASDPGIDGKKQMVVAANPHATAAGIEMLRAGGTAADAAIAMELVLSLVELQSSGIGGGAFAMYHDVTSGKILAYDGRETAPKDMPSTAFLNALQEPLSFSEAALGGRPVGVPGMVRLFETLHKKHGKLPWAKLFEPAIKLAKNGFEVSPRLHLLLTLYSEQLAKQFVTTKDLGATGTYFFTPDGSALPTGYLLKNPAYAHTLEILAANGADAFYNGPIAEAIADAVKTSQMNKTAQRIDGLVTLDDLKTYKVAEREPLCGTYRTYLLCSMAPPSSGATTVLAILGMLEHFDMKAAGIQTTQSVHLFAEASRLAFADRELYIGDPAFVDVPTKGLIDPAYLATRAALIDPEKAADHVRAGRPSEQVATLAPNVGYDYPSTSHMVVRDQLGNSLSMTATVQAAFGSFVMTGGFLLNNELTDFSFKPDVNGVPVANRVEGGKRPRSSMAPFLVFNPDGTLKMAIGSPGGSRIISFVAKTIIGVIDWGLSVQDAIDLPNMVNMIGVMEVERGSKLITLKPALQAMGHHSVVAKSLNSGLHGMVIEYNEDGTVAALIGGADPRREGDIKTD